MTVEVLSPDVITVTATSDTTFNVTVTSPVPISVESASVGIQGTKGDTGAGVPGGGAIAQRLAKKTTADFDTEWVTDIPAGVDKEIQFNDGGTYGSDTDFRWDKNSKSLVIGLPDLFTNNPLVIGKAIDDFLQFNIQNTSESAGASADIVATADNGDDTKNYVDMGINSSVYDVIDDISDANDSYLAANGGDLFLFADSTGKNIKMAVEGELIASVTLNGLELEAGKTVTNRPEIFYGTGSPPSATGKADGTLFFKYTP